MGIEIERKFLLLNQNWKNKVERCEKIVQGYLANTEKATIRIRIQGETANLNIKQMLIGPERAEFEYAVPISDAEQIINQLCSGPLIEKTRHIISQGKHKWEIDVFEGANKGLIVAEIELANTEEKFKRPEWLGEEVTDDGRYYNVSLINYPFKDWQ